MQFRILQTSRLVRALSAALIILSLECLPVQADIGVETPSSSVLAGNEAAATTPNPTTANGEMEISPPLYQEPYTGQSSIRFDGRDLRVPPYVPYANDSNSKELMLQIWHPPISDQVAEVLYATQSDCRIEHCHPATFVSYKIRDSRFINMILSGFTRKVELNNGVVGFYFPFKCGADCEGVRLSWFSDNLLHMLSTADRDTEKTFEEFAKSANSYLNTPLNPTIENGRASENLSAPAADGIQQHQDADIQGREESSFEPFTRESYTGHSSIRSMGQDLRIPPYLPFANDADSQGLVLEGAATPATAENLEVHFMTKPDCQVDECFRGTFDTIRTDDSHFINEVVSGFTRTVELKNRVVGFYIPFKCGHDCEGVNLAWFSGNMFHILSTRHKDSEEAFGELTKSANSYLSLEN